MSNQRWLGTAAQEASVKKAAAASAAKRRKNKTPDRPPSVAEVVANAANFPSHEVYMATLREAQRRERIAAGGPASVPKGQVLGSDGKLRNATPKSTDILVGGRVFMPNETDAIAKAQKDQADQLAANKARMLARNAVNDYHDQMGHTPEQRRNFAKARAEKNRQVAEFKAKNPELYTGEPVTKKAAPAPASGAMPKSSPARQHPLKDYYDQKGHTPEQQRNLRAASREADRRQAEFKKKNPTAYNFIPD